MFQIVYYKQANHNVGLLDGVDEDIIDQSDVDQNDEKRYFENSDNLNEGKQSQCLVSYYSRHTSQGEEVVEQNAKFENSDNMKL